jgi:hypothetical protein
MMAGALVFLAARAVATTIFLLTWAYGVTALSPFAFDMFVKPRLFWWLSGFVEWHHLWFGLAWALTSATLVPGLGRRRADDPWPRRAAWWWAVLYIGVVGGLSAYLLMAPRLALVTTATRDLLVVPGALVPLCWLAIVDHLSAWPASTASRASATTSQRRLLVTCLGSAVLLASSSVVRAALIAGAHSGPAAPEFNALWTLAISVMLFVGLYLLLVVVTSMAAASRRPFACEYSLVVALMALLLEEIFRQFVFPPLLLGARDATLTALPLGIAVSVTFAGWRLQTSSEHADTALNLLLGYRSPASVRTIVLVTVPIAAGCALAALERIDWAMTLGRLLAVGEAAVVFGVLLGATRSMSNAWSLRALLVPPLAALLSIHGLSTAHRAVVAMTGDLQSGPQAVLERAHGSDPLMSLGAGVFIDLQPVDPNFFGQLRDAEARLSALVPTAPARGGRTKDALPIVARPDVFVFVIDSLRRDYLAPYNDTASFTPSIARWAREQFVFQNTFTWYGGTWLSVPALWTGGAVTRRWATLLPDVNALEKLIAAEDYDFVINDYTVAGSLRPETRRTFLDPSVPSVQTDLCQNLNSLRAHLDGQPSGRPVFAYLSPMNVHILNTRGGASEETTDHDAFYAPYASRLKRIDGCFGDFIAYLKARGRYDDSIVILTADHGDSLGTDGRWGHQFHLVPEVVRVPLIVQLPAATRSQVTTDLGQVSFLTDITPTLYRLLGRAMPNVGPEFGEPLFVPHDEALPSRRRESFLLMSSYGSSYGMLSRNGRSLYFVDLMNRKESVLAMDRNPLGDRRVADGATRRVNRRRILAGLAQVERLYTAGSRMTSTAAAGARTRRSQPGTSPPHGLSRSASDGSASLKSLESPFARRVTRLASTSTLPSAESSARSRRLASTSRRRWHRCEGVSMPAADRPERLLLPC